MIQDLQKRPFARPLLMWIAGVVWQTCFPVSPFLLGFWLLPAAVLLFASAVLAGRKAHFSFGARWLWGAAVLPIFMFLAMQKTACSHLTIGRSDAAAFADSCRQVTLDWRGKIGLCNAYIGGSRADGARCNGAFLRNGCSAYTFGEWISCRDCLQLSYASAFVSPARRMG